MASQPITTAAELATLEEGDAVLVTKDGKTHALHVMRTAAPGPDTGSERRVTVGFGPGRWAFEVTIGAINAGFVTIERG